MKKRFKVGIIGLGVGERHLEAYLKFGCEVKKIFDLKKKKMFKNKKKNTRQQQISNNIIKCFASYMYYYIYIYIMVTIIHMFTHMHTSRAIFFFKQSNCA